MPPPQGTFNPLEGPGDFTTTKDVHSDTYAAIDPNKLNMADKAVLIVGASKGLGRAMATSYARAGASHIAIAARSDLSSVKDGLLEAAREAGRPEPRVLPMKLDVTDRENSEDAAKSIEEAFGKLDIVVNVSGVVGPMLKVADTDPDAWWNDWTVNIKGPYLVARAMLPLMVKGGDKTFVAVGSVGGHLVSPGLSAYQTTKLAVMRLMEFVSTEYEEQSVTAYTIHPGNILTGILGPTESLPDWVVNVCTETPELSADTVAWLTSEKRHWLAGRYINCMWDMPELVSKEAEIEGTEKLKVRLVL